MVPNQSIYDWGKMKDQELIKKQQEQRSLLYVTSYKRLKKRLGEVVGEGNGKNSKYI